MAYHQTEMTMRDEALDLLERTRRGLIDWAKAIAIELFITQGRVTSVMVIEKMRERGIDVDRFDKRWMGCVFRRATGWERVGYEPTGSHCRPVAIWTRR